VTWESGQEILNLDDIEHALNSVPPRATVETTEHRSAGQHDVVYEPALAKSPDGFTLTYTHEGYWIDVQSQLHEADGMMGKAIYRKTITGKVTKWICTWFGNDKPKKGIDIECKHSTTTRDRKEVQISVRDAKFRDIIFDIDPKCIITGEDTRALLQAAHIYQVHTKGSDNIDNGFVMRSDIHKLFDEHILTVSSDGKFKMDPIPKSYRHLFNKKEEWIEEPKIVKLHRYIDNINFRNEERLAAGKKDKI
jgi:hypothetical protein